MRSLPKVSALVALLGTLLVVPGNAKSSLRSRFAKVSSMLVARFPRSEWAFDAQKLELPDGD